MWIEFGKLLLVLHLVLMELHSAQVTPECEDGAFKCKNGQCIMDRWKCDGENDCGDFSDEENCLDSECKTGHFQCNNGECILGRWRCDGENDCTDNSDEENCGNSSHCNTSEFQCKDGQCIPSTWRCDGNTDCRDNSDEKNCLNFTACKTGQFQCKNGWCIPGLWRCDGDEDCPDNSDEANCTTKCQTGEFQCKIGLCLPARWRCDGDNDCPDHSDEENCKNYKKCKTGDFQCKNGRCIPASWRCDGNADCIDSSDEDNCVKILADLGGSVTLPCMSKNTTFIGVPGVRVKWTKVADNESLNEDVLLSMGSNKKTFGSFENRVFMQETKSEDASILITGVSVEDMGKYRCEISNGTSDTIQEVFLELQGCLSDGVVFPYQPPLGRYNMNFATAVQTCLDQDAMIATQDQLFKAWKGGLDCCNAGWLSDGTVRYAVTKPRGPCGGLNNRPGLRNYGLLDKQSLYDVFCYASALKGHFYWLVQPFTLTFDEAVQACLDDGAEIAKVGHIYAAWKLEGYDRCDAGWLADGSVRYPISRPRKNCSPTEAAVRFVGFPDKTQKSYGVYCYKAE